MNNSVQEARQALSAVTYFAGLDPQTFKTIIQAAHARNYDPGQLVILEGEPTTGLYVVQEGWLKVSKIAIDGREQIIQFLGKGEVFNAISIFTGAPNRATVTALEASRLWIISHDTMLQLLDKYPRITRLIVQDLAERITHLISLVEDLSLRTVEARLARLLLEQSDGVVVERKKWATQTEMASRLGSVSDVISRIMRRLIDQGIIQVSRNEIQILKRTELEKIAKIEESP